MKKNQKSDQNKKVQTNQSIPLATGKRIMSANKQFRTKQVRDAKRHPGSICITGHEYLEAISTTGATTGLNLLTLALNPLSFADTRLKKYGQLYEKFLFRKFVLHYTSADPSTATGQYIMAYDRDYADTTPPADDTGIRQYFAMKGSVISNVYLSSSFTCPLEDPQDFYYTNDTGFDGRLVFQGQLYFAAVSGTTFHGSVWIEYECELYDPSLESADSFSLMSSDAIEYTGSDFDSFPGYFDHLKYAAFSFNQKYGFQVEAVTSNTSSRIVLVGQKGIILQPGTYYLSIEDVSKSDGTSEVMIDSALQFNAFAWNRDVSRTKAIVDGVTPEYIHNDMVVVDVLEIDGESEAANSVSVQTKMVITIPVNIGPIWFFVTGFIGTNATIRFLHYFITAEMLEGNMSSETLKKLKQKGKIYKDEVSKDKILAYKTQKAEAEEQKSEESKTLKKIDSPSSMKTIKLTGSEFRSKV